MRVFTKQQTQQDIYVLVNEKGKILSYIHYKEMMYSIKGKCLRKIKYKVGLEDLGNVGIVHVSLYSCSPNILLKSLRAAYPSRLFPNLFKGFKEKRVTTTKNVTYTLHD